MWIQCFIHLHTPISYDEIGINLLIEPIYKMIGAIYANTMYTVKAVIPILIIALVIFLVV